MKTCILYAGKYGTTEHIAKMIQSKLGNDAVLINLTDQKKPDISASERAVIGSGVYMERRAKRRATFVKPTRANSVTATALPLLYGERGSRGKYFRKPSRRPSCRKRSYTVDFRERWFVLKKRDG